MAVPLRQVRSSDAMATAVLQTLGLQATLQMGGANTDPDLRGDVVFTTIDQPLSRYLMAP